MLARTLGLALLALLAVRQLLPETFEDASLSFIQDTGAGSGPTPATTAWLDTALLVGAALAFLRSPLTARACSAGADGGLSRGRIAYGWLLAGFAALALGVFVSTCVAAEKRVAANAGASLLAFALAGMALWRLASDRLLARLLVAATLAGGAVHAAKCVAQRGWEFRETHALWQKQKQDLAERGATLDDPAVINYERRLRSGDAFGFLFHPNVTGSCLMMGLVAGAGIALAGARGRESKRAAAVAFSLALCALLSVGVWLTGSAGAMLAGLGALFTLGALVVGAGRLRPGVLIASLAALYVALFAGAIGYGLARGGLPHPSLAFRWQYWRAAAHVYSEAPWTGVGRENFVAGYMRYKPPESTEDVRNAHDVWIGLLVELGPLGLLGGAILLSAPIVLGVRRIGTAPRERCGPPGSSLAGAAGSDDDPANDPGMPIWALASAAVILALHLPLSGTTRQIADTGGVHGILVGVELARIWLVQVGVPWLLAFLAALWTLEVVGAAPGGRVAVGAALVAALAGALLHNLIGFSLFTPAGLSVFVALAAAIPGVAGPSPGPRTGRRWRAVSALVAAGAVAHVWLCAVPATTEAARLRSFRSAFRPNAASLEATTQAAQRVCEADSWSSEAPREIARLFGAAAGSAPPEDAAPWLRQAVEFADLALARNPVSVSSQRIRAALEQRRAATFRALGQDAAAFEALRQAARDRARVVALNPMNERDRIRSADAHFELLGATASPDARSRALADYESALAIDATRPAENASKLAAAEAARIRNRAASLRKAAAP